MATRPGTLGSIALQLAGLLQPIQERFGPGGPRLLAAELGLRLPPSFDTNAALVAASGRAEQNLRAIPDQVAELVSAVENGSDADIVDTSVRLAASIAQAVDALGAVGAAFRGAGPGSGIPVAELNRFADEFSGRVLDYLLVSAAEAAFGVVDALEFMGALERVDVPAGDAQHPAFIQRRLHLDQLLSFVAHPGEQLKALYGWGTPEFTGLVLLRTLAKVLRRMNVPVIEDTSGPVPVLDVVFAEIGPRGGTPSGLAFTVVAPVPEIPFAEHDGGSWHTTFTLKLPLPVGTELLLRSDDQVTVTPPPGTEIEGELAVEFTAGNPGGDPFVVLGEPGGSRLEAGELTARTGLLLDWDPVAGHATGAIRVGGEVKAVKLLIDASSGDGFVSTILGGGRLTAGFDLAFVIDSEHGLQLGGSGGLELELPVHLALGPVEVQIIHLAARLEGEAVALELSAGFSAVLGPIQASVDRLGVLVDLSFPDGGGNVGPANLDFAFKPPSGVGLAVDAGVIAGGGFLNFVPERREYEGVLELELADFLAIKAIGLITTRMPDGSSGFSLLIVLTAEFPSGIQLGAGFTLLAVGGLVGLNRGMNLQALVEGVSSGAIESVAFPKDVIANAPRILSDLNRFFPPEQGTFLVGPMVKIGWGTPTLISVSLGVIIEIPGDIAILGVVRAALPTADQPLLQIQAQFLGALELDKSRAWFFATLFDSNILGMTVDGGMGVLVSWGEVRDLIITIGGFHPDYRPPPLPFPVPDRLAVNLLNSGGQLVRVSGYFAITSNTVQFGGEAHVVLGFSEFRVEGDLKVDGLIQRSPFRFTARSAGDVSLKVFGIGVFTIHLDFTLEGIAPWRAHGRGSIGFLFFSVSADFDITWGDVVDVFLPPVVVLDVLFDELSKPEGWETRLPSGGRRSLVNLRTLPATDNLVLHPLGTLVVSQRAMPLGVRVDRLGGQRASDGPRFSVAPALNSGLEKVTDTGEKFAMAQYQNMSDAAKLSRPSYETQDAGLELTSNEGTLATARVVRRAARYELHVIGAEPDATTSVTALAAATGTPVKRFHSVSSPVFDELLRGSSTSRGVLSARQARQKQPFAGVDTVRVDEQRFVVAYIKSNRQAFPPGVPGRRVAATFRSVGTAQDALADFVKADAGLTGLLHVIPAAEAAVTPGVPGTWSPAGVLPTPVSTVDIVPLPSGTSLIAGGTGEDGTPVAATALFDPTADAWSSGPSLGVARQRHTTTRLFDGRVLVAGGQDAKFAPLAAAEVFDVATRHWTPTPTMAMARHGHTATRLNDGRVLVTGGSGVRGDQEDGALATAELYDPATGEWTETGPMTDARTGHQAVLLNDHRVMVVGGVLPTGGDRATALTYCEIYDPNTREWTPTGSLREARAGHQAVTLQDDRVLVTGGDPVVAADGTLDPHSLATAELYTPGTERWTIAAPLTGGGRSGHRALVTRSGAVLVTGGTGAPERTAGYRSVIVFDPKTDTWSVLGGLLLGRSAHAITELADDRVLVAAGTEGIETTATGEVLIP